MTASAIRFLLHLADQTILLYFFMINSSYLALMAIASVDLVKHQRRQPLAGSDDTYRSPLTQPVTVLMPAYNEGPGIVSAVQAVLALRYPSVEIVVIDDGSADDTFDRLAAEFDLVEVRRVVPREVPFRGAVLSVHVPRAGPDNLVVVRKANGGKADALNVGINLARSPLICMVDADSVLDPDTLLSVGKPFGDDVERVAATGGIVRVVNGCQVLAGRVVEARVARNWLCRIQVVEYLRAFLLGRTGWSRLGALTIISGAFGLFRRDLLVEVGGLDPDCIGEDAELVVRLHHHLRRRRLPYRIVFVAEPVSWSEVPFTGVDLARQRRRWHRGLTELLYKHRRMILNPRYGRIGLFALPYVVVFEFLGPMVELAGVILVPAGQVLGAVDTGFAWRFLLVSYCYACLVSVIALAIEELTFHRYHRWGDLGAILAAAVLENVGYRQFTAWHRLRGAWAAIRRHPSAWGAQTRSGFDQANAAQSTS
jgi:cellulose synthase/poly-beta-1,6-N-acetylglucosamine synthase-like glycosyltransferase